MSFVTVVVPTYKHWDELRLCVAALKNQSYKAECYEVLIINNEPTSSPPDDFDLPINFRILDQPLAGSYASRNLGIASARGEIIAFTDSDCIPHLDWLKNGVAALENGVNRVAGRVEIFFESNKLNIIEIYEKIYAFDQALYAKNGGAVTANFMTWKKHFNDVGVFNALMMSGGDMEWGARATSKGITIDYVSDVVVYHPSRSNIKDLKQKLKRTTGGRYFIRQNSKKSLLKLFTQGFLPPLKAVIPTLKSDKGSFTEKVIALNMLYLIKIYCSLYVLKIYLFKLELERQ